MKEKLPNNKNIKSKKEILDKVYFFFLDVNGFFNLFLQAMDYIRELKDALAALK